VHKEFDRFLRFKKFDSVYGEKLQIKRIVDSTASLDDIRHLPALHTSQSLQMLRTLSKSVGF
jgi:hypothetical protein